MSRPLDVAMLSMMIAVGSIGLTPALAEQGKSTIVVGRITSEKSCKVYQESAGGSAVVATRYAVAAVESWRTWLVKDCVDNFATMRTSLEAALASSGKFAVKDHGAGYTVSGSISRIGGDGDSEPATSSASGNGYSVSSQQIFASIDVTLRDASGRIVYGGLLTKHLETGSDIRTSNLQTSSRQSGEAVYTELQHEVALAVARLVAFHIDPLRVVAVDGREIRLNYGSPLLRLGTVIHAAGAGGGAVRYAVTSANEKGATADVDGEAGDWTKVITGSLATVVEADDPATNERRIKSVDLP